ncbi:Polysaccharide biosynthesis protein C-terminal domain-containing protein [Flavobacterium longum]|uniref:oligosaccharide flippase family protein n=1 Tax=Flavobacterium longum TaxID=1299340 RepID=UPI0039ED83CD
MGIVGKQSIRNTIVTYIGFAIGAVNALYMYPIFLGETFYGLTNFILSSANIMMPLMAFGVHNTMVKFYSGYKTEEEKSSFLTFMLFLPLLFIVPVMLIGLSFQEDIAALLSQRNAIIHDYVWMIPVIGLCMGYFEIFYAWVKVHFKSVYGSFLREVLLRVFMSFFLIAVYQSWLTPVQFIYASVWIYVAITVMMIVSAFRVKKPVFTMRFPAVKKPLFVYSLFIIFSGSVANLLLDIDKFMLSQYININNVAYYSVAVFITLVIAVPSRAMHQIAYPLTAKLMTENKMDELNSFYKKTSISLQIVGGFVFLAILVNIKQVYLLLPAKYSGGIFVVFTIGLSKYLDLILGNNNAIIFNSKYYRMVLFLGLMLGIFAIGLNMVLIPKFGINGAAVATLLAVTLYISAKLMFVVFKMKLFPFTRQTVYSLFVSVAVFFLFYYWDFGYHPLVNILLKSALLTVVYVYANYKLKLSSDLNEVMDKVIGRFRP